MKTERSKFTPIFSVTMALLMAVSFGISAATSRTVQANSIEEQIDAIKKESAALQKENDANRDNLDELKVQASNYQDAIGSLQQQINTMQQAINANKTKQADLQDKMKKAEVKLNTQKKFLSEDIRAMYVDGDMSILEMLASSKNLSAFVDKQEYRISVQNNIKATVDEIQAIKAQLKKQKDQVDQLVKTQQAQQVQLNANKAKQSSLLSMNQNQQDEYTAKLKANKDKIAKLQAQQAALNALLTSNIQRGGTGGYPWANVPCPFAGGGSSCYSYNWGYAPDRQSDPLGWGYRNCTSYVFWKLSTLGYSFSWQKFPNVYNSNWWYPGDPQGAIKESWRDFQQMGYKDSNQNLNDGIVVAVRTQGYYGHIMFVMGANGDDVIVSQYNAEENGTFSTGHISRYEPGIHFIHITN